MRALRNGPGLAAFLRVSGIPENEQARKRTKEKNLSCHLNPFQADLVEGDAKLVPPQQPREHRRN